LCFLEITPTVHAIKSISVHLSWKSPPAADRYMTLVKQILKYIVLLWNPSSFYHSLTEYPLSLARAAQTCMDTAESYNNHERCSGNNICLHGFLTLLLGF
jgi:hypothetical protein